MENTYRLIGDAWVSIDPHDILSTSDFIHSSHYEDCIEKGKSNIERYVNNNKTMLSLVIKNGGYNAYALRQLIYQNSCISHFIDNLQKEGRYYYRCEAIKRIREAIAPEYANLPEFFRSAYCIDDIVLNYFREATAGWKNKINKEATAYFYQSMRDYIYKIL